MFKLRDYVTFTHKIGKLLGKNVTLATIEFEPKVIHVPFLFLCLLSPSSLHQQFANYKEQVRRIGPEPPQQRQQGQHKDDAPTCGICHKTKFADGCGNLCSYCQTKFCARCGGRVSLRSNNVSTTYIA